MGNPEKPRRYRTGMFDNRLSLSATSEQVRQLQAESEAEKRSVASLVREAIDQFLPRLRDRRRKRERPPDGQSAGRTEGGGAQNRFLGQSQETLLQLLGEPQKRTAREWRYGHKGSLKINLENWTWYDSQTKEGGSVLDDPVRIVVDLPPGSGVGPVASKNLAQYGVKSASLYRGLLNLAYHWFEPGRTRRPVRGGK